MVELNGYFRTLFYSFPLWTMVMMVDFADI